MRRDFKSHLCLDERGDAVRVCVQVIQQSQRTAELHGNIGAAKRMRRNGSVVACSSWGISIGVCLRTE
jgi:hypothetical protein